jgi:hypothetical protein
MRQWMDLNCAIAVDATADTAQRPAGMGGVGGES